MKLTACPLCVLVENAEGDDVCAKITYGGQKAVASRLHTSNVASNVIRGAFDLLGEFKGTVRDIDVAGHWGLVVVPGDWTGVESKSVTRGE